jgi:hypothetical protein
MIHEKLLHNCAEVTLQYPKDHTSYSAPVQIEDQLGYERKERTKEWKTVRLSPLLDIRGRFTAWFTSG